MKKLLIIFLCLVSICFSDTYTSHQKPTTDSALDIGTSELLWRKIYADAFTDNTFLVSDGVFSAGTWQADTVGVQYGGTGQSSFTDGVLLLGGNPIGSLGVAANGQIPIGDGSGAPVLNTLTAGAGAGVTNGAGTITISLDPTSFCDATWCDGSQNFITWTWDLITDDPQIDFRAGEFDFNDDNLNTTGLINSVELGKADTDNYWFGDTETMSAGANLSSASNNIAIGSDALETLTTADNNIAIGTNALDSLADGGNESNSDRNIGIGTNAGAAITTGVDNIAIGDNALPVQNHDENIAIGTNALLALSGGSGGGNVAIGFDAMKTSTNGNDNVYVGNNAGSSVGVGTSGNTVVGSGGSGQTQGDFNVAIGRQALGDGSILANRNIAIGYQTMQSSTSGTYTNNIAMGFQALDEIASGNHNIVMGSTAGHELSTGDNNIAIGRDALDTATTVSNLIAIGQNTLTAVTITATDDIAIGTGAGALLTTGAQNVLIGTDTGAALAAADDNNIMLGYLAGKYETGSDSLYIDALDRTDEATAKTNSLIYGTFHATPASQTLAINAAVSTPYTLGVTGTGTFGEIIDSGLTVNLGVYTDGSKQLTSTPPTSGVIGYWSRAGTVISTATAGDDVTTTGTVTGGTITDGTGTLTGGVLNDVTGFGDGADASIPLLFDLSGTSFSMTASSNLMTFGGGVVVIGNSSLGDDNEASTVVNLVNSGTNVILTSTTELLSISESLDVAGHAAFGTDASVEANSIIRVFENITGTGSSKVLSFDGDWQGASNASTNYLYGGFFNLRINPDGSTVGNITGELCAVHGQVTTNWNSTVAIAKLSGVCANFFGDGDYTGTITDFALFRGVASAAAFGGAVTDMYGLLLPNIDLAAAGSNWSVYTNAGPARFGDAVYFTQTDGEERIDSATATTLDLYATDSIELHDATNTGDGTNEVQVSATGDILLAGDATVFDDIRTPLTAIRITGPGGTTPPDEVLYKGSAVLAFGGAGTDDEKAFFIVQIPHWYKEGSDIVPHIHWVPEDNTAGNVRWVLTYSWANIDAAFPGESTDTIVVAADETTDKHQRDNFLAITGAGKTISSMLLCSIQREDSDGTDTYNNKDAYLLEIDFHAEKDAMGSRLIGDSK